MRLNSPDSYREEEICFYIAEVTGSNPVVATKWFATLRQSTRLLTGVCEFDSHRANASTLTLLHGVEKGIMDE